MVGWTDQEMPGLVISPNSSQKKFRTMLVANLKYGGLPKPQPDSNAFEDVSEKAQAAQGRRFNGDEPDDAANAEATNINPND